MNRTSAATSATVPTASRTPRKKSLSGSRRVRSSATSTASSTGSTRRLKCSCQGRPSRCFVRQRNKRYPKAMQIERSFHMIQYDLCRMCSLLCSACGVYSFCTSTAPGYVLRKILFTPLPIGTSKTRANHGVAQTLATILNGNNAFVVTYAAANCSTNCAPFCCVRTRDLSPSSVVEETFFAASTSSLPTHPFLVIHFPNFCIASLNEPSSPVESSGVQPE